MDEKEEFFGESLSDFAKWIARIAEAHPEATIRTYELALIQAKYDPRENRVETS